MDEITRIDLFDFDGTIFNSPEPSVKLWGNKLYGKLMAPPKSGGLGWFQNVLTLQPKYLTGCTFNDHVVDAVKKSMADEHSLTVMLTGRTDNYESLVKNIISNVGLVFDDYGFKPLNDGGTTFDFKEKFVKDLILSHPNVNYIQIWEDRTKHLHKFREMLTKLGIEGNVVYVEKQETHMPEDMEVEVVGMLESIDAKKPIDYSKAQYFGVFLDELSKQKLLALLADVIPVDWKIYAHHMTILFGKNKNSIVEEYIKTNIGKKVSLEAVAVGISADAIAVKISSDVSSDNKTPHITIATPQRGKPVNSNYITDWKEISPVEISGKIDAYFG